MEIAIVHISEITSSNNNNNIKLLIIDSLINPYRVEYRAVKPTRKTAKDNLIDEQDTKIK
ncbi:MAG: hypothetical protein ACRD8K_08150 [Nitrososphaeraceae archaeon]